MTVLVMSAMEATREATCHQAGLLSGLVNMIKIVKRSCSTISSVPSMPVSLTVIFFHTDPRLTRPVSINSWEDQKPWEE